MPYSFFPEYFAEVAPALVANDDAATTPSNTPVNIPVLANDTLGENPVQLADLVGPPTVFEPPTNGTVEVQPDGSIVYTPNPGFTGEDAFGYQIETPVPCVEVQAVFVTEFNDWMLRLATGQAQPNWWGDNQYLVLDLPSGIYDLEFNGPETGYFIYAEGYPAECDFTENGEVVPDGEAVNLCVTWVCPPALLNLGCSWEPRNAPSTDDNGGVAFKPDWFVDNDPFTVSDPVNGWTETWQWDGDLGYDLLASTGTSTRPNCCGDGSGLTLTQGSNTVDLDWRYNCA